jgi:uncharacterized membrane protein
LALASTVCIVAIAPPNRLLVDSLADIDHPPLLSWATVTLLSIAGVLVMHARMFHNRAYTSKLWLGAFGVLVYSLSVCVVDFFQTRVGDDTGIPALQKQAQVALSILWASLGFCAFGFGVVRGRALARIGGLALLCLATLKVFIFDLAALDTSYRVLSFVGLGVLLLVSSYTYQRVVHQDDRNDRSPSPA